MVWNYPDISLEEMMKLIKGFVDIMILASGYQSSGLLAQWDAHNIKKAFQWASFFENVLGQISSSDAYQDSVKELDVALRELTLYPSFPQGLANLSYGTLNRARDFVMAHLFHTLPLRDSHLRAFLTAIIEMDLDKHSGPEHDYLSVYLNRFNLLSERRGLVKDSVIAVEDNIPTREIGRFTDDDLTTLTLEEMFKRQSAVSCISKVGTGLDILSNAIRCCSWTVSDSSLSEEQLKHERAQAAVRSADQLVDFITWNRWKSLNLSYFLNNRTVRLVSGASMIFSAPKVYWEQTFERLNTSAKCKDDDDLQEMIELMLLGCITSKWNHLIEYFISVSYDPFTISKLYHEVCSLFTGRYQSSHSKEESTDAKENAILEYLDGLVDGQLHQLWKLSPVLVAVAVPFWSPLFRLYLSEIESQFRGDSSVMRCCSCVHDRKEHGDYCLLHKTIFPNSVVPSAYEESTNHELKSHKVLNHEWDYIRSLSLFSQRKKLAMKNLSLQSVKKNQFQKWRKRIASTESAITLGNVKNQASFGCCCGSYVLRQLVWKFRTKWKQALGWRRSSGVRYTYDIHSYSLNFDNGLHHGHLPSRGSQ